MSKNHLSLTLKLCFFSVFVVVASSYSSAQCTFGNDIGGFDPQNNFDWAQTFTAECDGFLEYVEFITGSGGTQQARSLEIFEGATVSGNPVYVQNFPSMSFGAAGESLRINIGEEFPIENGDVFTFQIPGVTVNLLVNVAANGNPDVYPEGFAWENGNSFNELVDFVFNVSITDVLSVNDFDLTTIIASPNPVSDLLTISLSRSFESANTTIFDSLGRQIQNSIRENSSEMQLDVSSLSSGIYFAVVNTNFGQRTLRFVKS